jgi:hypothetical protein
MPLLTAAYGPQYNTHAFIFCFPCAGKQVRENPGFLQLRKIDAAVKVANTISTSANRVFLDSNALLLNVNDITLRYCNADG